MGRYVNGKKVNDAASVTNVSQDVDVNAIAAAVAKALGNMGVSGTRRINTGEELQDTFTNSAAMEKIADAMIVQRGEKESNFKDLGGVKETKKDKKEVDKTIDLLKGLDD